MVNKFECDMCGATVGFEENAALIRKGEKLADLCPECDPKVQSFIKESKAESETKQDNASVNEIGIVHALKILKDAGYVFYKRNRK